MAASRRRALLLAVAALAVVVVVGAGVAVGALLASGANRPTTTVDAPETPAADGAETTDDEGTTPVDEPVEEILDAYAGTWTGEVEGDVSQYSLLVTITPGAGVYTASGSYPELSCEVTWAETTRTPTAVGFTETVNAGSRCFDQVPVTLQALADGSLAYSALSGGRTITATLARVG